MKERLLNVILNLKTYEHKAWYLEEDGATLPVIFIEDEGGFRGDPCIEVNARTIQSLKEKLEQLSFSNIVIDFFDKFEDMKEIYDTREPLGY